MAITDQNDARTQYLLFKIAIQRRDNELGGSQDV